MVKQHVSDNNRSSLCEALRNAGLSITSPICRNHNITVLALIVKHRNLEMLKWTLERHTLSTDDKHSALLAIVRDLNYEIDVEIIDELIRAGAYLLPNDSSLFNINLLRQKNAFRSKHFFSSSLNDKLLLCLCQLIDCSHKQWRHTADYSLPTNLLRTVLECYRATKVQNQSTRFSLDVENILKRLLTLGADISRCCESTITKDQHVYTFQHFDVLIRAAHSQEGLTRLACMLLSDRHGYTPPLYHEDRVAFLADVKLLHAAGHRLSVMDIGNYSDDVQEEIHELYGSTQSLLGLSVVSLRRAIKRQNVYQALDEWTVLPNLIKNMVLLHGV